MFGIKGSLPLKWKQKGKVWIMPCPRPQNREAKKEERKRMITQVVMLPRSCLQLEGPIGAQW